MGLLDGFEKLINEHGSAAILKERIALAEDKYAALEQKLSECEAAKIKSHAENEALRLDLEKATVEIQNLKKLTEKVHGSRLEEIREKILVLLSQHEELEAEQISRLLNIGVQLAKFHLEELLKSEMVKDYWAIDSPVYYGLIQGGRAYLVSHGLLA